MEEYDFPCHINIEVADVYGSAGKFGRQRTQNILIRTAHAQYRSREP